MMQPPGRGSRSFFLYLALSSAVVTRASTFPCSDTSYFEQNKCIPCNEGPWQEQSTFNGAPPGMEFSVNCGKDVYGGRLTVLHTPCKDGMYNKGDFMQCKKCSSCKPGTIAHGVCNKKTGEQQCCHISKEIRSDKKGNLICCSCGSSSHKRNSVCDCFTVSNNSMPRQLQPGPGNCINGTVTAVNPATSPPAPALPPAAGSSSAPTPTTTPPALSPTPQASTPQWKSNTTSDSQTSTPQWKSNTMSDSQTSTPQWKSNTTFGSQTSTPQWKTNTTFGSQTSTPQWKTNTMFGQASGTWTIFILIVGLFLLAAITGVTVNLLLTRKTCKGTDSSKFRPDHLEIEEGRVCTAEPEGASSFSTRLLEETTHKTLELASSSTTESEASCAAPLRELLGDMDTLEALIMLLDPDTMPTCSTRHLAARYGFSSTWTNYAYSLRDRQSPLRMMLESMAASTPDTTVGDLMGVLASIGRQDAVKVLQKPWPMGASRVSQHGLRASATDAKTCF